MPNGERIAEFLLSIGAVKLQPSDPFTWTSGIKSPIYCDNRMIYSHPEARNIVVNALRDRVKTLHVPPDVIAGTATAAIGWAALVADRMQLPFVYIRAKAKEHGAKKRIEGDLKPEKHVVLIEDLLSTGGSAISSVEAIREEGKGIITDVVAIFTYEMLSSLEGAQSARVQLHPLSNISTLVEVALGQGRITEKEAELVHAFVKYPEGWSRS
ncbi:MAG TPA: orotate phosphoribosyltransferase [Candidatus Peribacteraceae bacterium]|nr:orotate phosphoribosyltransferase [Candidatus Peribacteraceae bacterium]